MPETKEWTLMFYFASDNPLAPGIISQLKALKAAGFHRQANVIAQFDPYTPGTPTHIFDVNIIKKLESPEEFKIGFDSEDPFIRNLVEDKLWRDERDRTGQKLIRDRIREGVKDYAPGVPPSGTIETNGHRFEMSPLLSLGEFLRFCSSRYPAKHYMLFLLGHGVVVGNDIFMFDEHAEQQQSLSLAGLRRVLEDFTLDIRSHDGTFEMVSFHSCSVSSLEVAFELKNTAKYMLASQGTTFVGSWPYREILLRIFKDVRDSRNNMKDADIKEMLTKIFSYCLHNSTDFLLAGYPFDLCLCDLKQVEEVRPSLNRLSAALIKAVETCPYREAIQLAHLEAQSFYQEMYTDIIDFCRCLLRRIGGGDDAAWHTSNGKPAAEKAASVDTSTPELAVEIMVSESKALLPVTDASADFGNALEIVDQKVELQLSQAALLESIKTELKEACVELIRAIRASIVRRGFAGPEYQYARGLSIYFPWSRPGDDSGIFANYAKYKIVVKDPPPAGIEDAQVPAVEPKTPGWLDFIEAYLTHTRRRQSIFLEKPMGILNEHDPDKLSEKEKLLEDKIALVYTQAAPSSAPNVAGSLQKTDKTDPMGADCSCPSIKNYPRDTRPRRERTQPSQESLAFAPAFFRQSS
jgi:Clostripain family